MPRVVGKPGYRTRSTPGGPPAAGRARRRCAWARSTRRCRVRSPRSASQASKGPGSAPVGSCGARRSRRPSRLVARSRRRRARRSEWPDEVLGRAVHDDVGAEARAAAGAAASRRCCRPPAAHRAAAGRVDQRSAGRRRRAAGWSATRPTPGQRPPSRRSSRAVSVTSTRRTCSPRSALQQVERARAVPSYGRAARRPRQPPCGSRSRTAATPPCPEAKASVAARPPGRRLRPRARPGRVAVAAVAHVAACVVGRGEHRRRVQSARPAARVGRPACTTNGGGGEWRVGRRVMAARSLLRRSRVAPMSD